MVLEAFLACALAASPLLAFPKGDIGPPEHPLRLITQSASFLGYLTHREPLVLIVGGDAKAVLLMRDAGIKAFGALTQDQPATMFHAVTDPGQLSFQPRHFHQVYWSHPKYDFYDPGYEWLIDAIKLVEPRGFFLFDEEEMLSWGMWLRQRNWEKLPFSMGRYSIWQNKNSEDYFKRSA